MAWPAVARRGRAARADPDQPRLRGQRQPQLAGPRPADGPALRDRQARDHAVVPPTSTPGRSGCSATPCTRSSRSPRSSTMISVLVVLQHDLGTALVLFAILLGLLWVVGVPARLFGLAFSIIGVAAFYLAATNAERRNRLITFTDPFKDFQGSGWQAGHGLLGMASGGVFGKGVGAASRSGATCPRRTPTSSSPSSARSSAWSAPCWCCACSVPSRTPRSGSPPTPRTCSCATSPPASRSG